MTVSLSDAIKALTKLTLESKLEVLREVLATMPLQESPEVEGFIEKYSAELEKENKKKARKSKGTEVVKEKRKLNSYNIFIQEKLKEMRELHPGEANTKHMSLAVALWNKQKKESACASSGNEAVSE